MHSRRYSAFISYRHADNTQEGRRWAEWLHRALERYVVPPDLIGTPNLRGEPIRDSLYPIFRDEDELPANADLATGIRAALEVSDHLIVLCSPRSAVSPWVRKEVREFKELGRSDRILAIIIAGEPNADDPAKARDGIMRDEECFCEELRFGAVRGDGMLDWSIRTEPLAADLRPVGTRAEGFVTAEAYREYLTVRSSYSSEKIADLAEDYRKRLDHGLLKVIAGMLGVPLGQLFDRDVVHRAELAEAEAAKQRQIAERERQLAEQAQRSADEANLARLETEETAHRLAIALAEANRQLERSQVEEGRAWLERGRAALNKGDHLSALMLAGRAVGYHRYGRGDQEVQPFSDAFPLLLARPMQDLTAEKERAAEAGDVTKFLESVRFTLFPLWAGTMSESVRSVAFSPDGTRLASGSDDHTIKLWDTATGKEVATLQGHTDYVSSVAFSPDGTRLASGSKDKTIRLWDAMTGKEIIILQGDHYTCFAFSPDGTRLAIGHMTIKLWDTATGEEIAMFQGHMPRHVYSVVFSPDGTRLASGSNDHTIKLWDTATGEELASLQGHTSDVNSVAFSPNGTRLASGSGAYEINGDYTIKLWDLATHKELASLQGHKYRVRSVAFSPDGTRLASGSEDKSIKLWDIATCKELASLEGHTSDVNSVAFSPDGTRMASGSADNTIKLWVTATGQEVVRLQGHTEDVVDVAFSPDGTFLASGAQDHTIKFWDSVTGKELASLQGHTNGVYDVAFSPDGSFLASGSHDKTIKLWDTATGKELSLEGHPDYVLRVAFSPDSKRLASGSGDKTIKLWDTTTGKELTSLQGHTEVVASLAFSPDSTRLASGSGDKTVKLWDTATGKELTSFEGHPSMVSIVAFNPDGTRLASGSADSFGKGNNTIKLWDTVTGKELATLQGVTHYLSRVAFSPDGTRLASVSYHWYDTIKLWETATGKELASAKPEELAAAKKWLAASEHRLSADQHRIVECADKLIFIVPDPPDLDLTAPLREGLLSLPGRELEFPEIKKTTRMIHARQDTLAQLADPKLIPELRAELRMELCTKSGQFRAATAQWQALPEQAANSHVRRLYLLALIDATKRPQIHGYPTTCQTAVQISHVLTKEMMATPTISLAMMSLMQTLARDATLSIPHPRTVLMNRLEEVATQEWLAVLREDTANEWTPADLTRPPPPPERAQGKWADLWSRLKG